jgi:hypothetical protein
MLPVASRVIVCRTGAILYFFAREVLQRLFEEFASQLARLKINDRAACGEVVY